MLISSIKYLFIYLSLHVSGIARKLYSLELILYRVSLGRIHIEVVFVL